jgi:hypothetical protein
VEPRGWHLDWHRLLVGNWVGAGQTALAALLVTGVLSGILGLLAKPDDLGVANTLTLITVIATGTFGADMVGDLDFGFDGTRASYSFGAIPLTITLVSLLVAGFIFRRLVARYPAPGAAVADAVRAALIFGVGLLVPALIFRSDNDELGSGWGHQLSSRELGLDANVGASAPGAFFLGFLFMVITLLLTLLVRRDWWPSPVARFQDWFAAPLYGYAVVFLLLPAAGALGLLSMALFGEPTIEDTDPSSDNSAVASVLVAGLASGGMWVIGLGSGANFGTEYAARGGGQNEHEATWEHLWGAVTEDEPGLWIAPLILLAVLAAAAVVVLRKAAPGFRLVNLMSWALGFMFVTPLLVRLSGLHGNLRAEDAEDTYRVSYFVGMHGIQTTFFLCIAALVVAIVVAALVGALDLGEVRRRTGALAGAIQRDPGRHTSPSPPPGSATDPTPPSPPAAP